MAFRPLPGFDNPFAVMKRFFCVWIAVFSAVFCVQASQLDELRKAFIRASVVNYAPDEQMVRQFIEYSDYGRANDVLLLQLYMSVRLPDDEVARLLELLDERGAWTDINYADQMHGRWQPTLHLTRLYALAKLYADPSSSYYKDMTLGRTIHQGLDYWLSLKPQSPNWWHNDIGVPKKFTAILLMLYDELTKAEIAGGLELLERSAFGMTGQNKVWLAGNNLMKGLLVGDEALVAKARNVMIEEIVLTAGEGIQPDWSFHQHGPQIQFGNYGLAYAEGLSFWFRVLDGSSYAFTVDHYRILRGLMLEGICWSVWQGTMDPSFCGRQVFINAGRGKACSLAVAMQNMAATNYPGSREFACLAWENLRPERYQNSLCGTRYYWRSDCGIYRSRTWYASIRMHSKRTVGFEMTNGENRLANFSADGALLLMQHGREYDNIFASWDWRRVPGTTAFDDGNPIKSSNVVAEKRNYSRWVGGVCSDKSLCTTMELRRDSLHAIKSNFFFENVVVALGCGIGHEASACRELFTTIDQTHLNGEVTVGSVSGNVRHIVPEVPVEEILGPGTVSWVHHDNRGYVLLDETQVELSTILQYGKWDWIDPFYKNFSQAMRVFKYAVQHNSSRKDNKYAYALLPCRTADQTACFAAMPTIEVLRNDTLCQAVAYGKTLCAVFHQKGTLKAAEITLKTDAPSLIIIENEDVMASSPKGGVLTVSLQYRGMTRVLRFDLPVDAERLGAVVLPR